MIKVEKDFENIPTILKSKNREEAFKQNKEAKKFIDTKNLYKPKSIQKKLFEIYHGKCAYCEDTLLNAPKHIEHYRPKDTYYWLAYSWDNLLLCCTSCNSTKGVSFKTQNQKVIYNSEKFEDIHNLRDTYDKIENPFIINPEKDDILTHIFFNNKAEIFSDDKRVKYTIDEACKLNRDELVQKRIKIFNSFRQNIEEHYEIFKSKKDITRFLPDINNFIKACDTTNDFYAFRYFIINNIEYFFEGKLRVIIARVIKSHIGEN